MCNKFPRKLKIAKVLSNFNVEDHKVIDNYHPISWLTSISNLFEKVVLLQFHDYCLNINDHYEINFTYEFRLLFHGLKQGFRYLYTRISITKPAHYGTDSMQWFISCLTGRMQSVEINKHSHIIHPRPSGFHTKIFYNSHIHEWYTICTSHSNLSYKRMSEPFKFHRQLQ